MTSSAAWRRPCDPRDSRPHQDHISPGFDPAAIVVAGATGILAVHPAKLMGAQARYAEGLLRPTDVAGDDVLVLAVDGEAQIIPCTRRDLPVARP
jgi:hypothetical protein